MHASRNKLLLTILYFNVRSLIPKIDNLRILCSIYSPDVICVVESWLDTDIDDSEISIQGYSVIRLDRSRHGGGVLIYVNCLFFYSLLFKGAADFECIVLSLSCSVHHKSSPDVTITLFYRPPNSCPSLLDSLFTTLCNLNVSLFSNFILLGDFNIDYFCTRSLLFSKLSSVTSSFNLT